jgi:hypothetical protein
MVDKSFRTLADEVIIDAKPISPGEPPMLEPKYTSGNIEIFSMISTKPAIPLIAFGYSCPTNTANSLDL